MLKTIFITIVIINGLSGVLANDTDDLLQVLDSLLSPLMPIGLVDTPLVEDGPKLKKLCELLNKDFIKKQIDKVSSSLKGLYGELCKRMLQFSSDQVEICQLLKNNELDKAQAMAKEFNRHAVEANKLRLSFLTAVHELNRKGTRASLSTLACYVNQLTDKMIAIYPDKDGAKVFIKSAMNHIFKEIVGLGFEKEGIKAAENCTLPEATNNPSKYNSIVMAVYASVKNLQDK